MSLRIKEVMDIMESYAPLELMEEYDNVGLMVGDKEKEVTKILFSLDCTLNAIEEAKVKGCNLIITHHPLLFKKPKNITMDTIQGKKIISLIEKNIALYSAHTNLDVTHKGLNDIIMRLLGFSNFEIIEKTTMASDAGTGRLVTISEGIRLIDLLKQVKEKLGIDNLRYSGDLDKIVRKVAVINGSGEDYFDLAVEKGSDCIITGDTTYHYVSDFNEAGVCIIDAGHFETEWPSFKWVAEFLKSKLDNEQIDASVIISETCLNPYKYF